MTKPDLKKETKRLKKWLERQDYFDSAVEGVQHALSAQPNAGDTVDLECLSTWYGYLGNLLVLEGKAQGWVELRRSFEYQSCAIRIIAAYQDAGKYSAVGIGDIATWLSFSLAFRVDSFATWLGDRIIGSLASKADKYELGPPKAPYYFAFIQFYALWRKKSFNVRDYSDEPMGVYQEIFDNWSNEEQYLEACLKACEYHVKRMHDDQGYPEFLGARQDLLPVEILMIRRIRDDLGLPNPEIDHPLMQTPLGHAPKQLPEVKDDLLERVTAKAKADLERFPKC